MSDSLSRLYDGLCSNLTTKRKSALKSLVTFLDQEQQADKSRDGGGGGSSTTWLCRLDAATAAVPAGSAIPQETWPALLHETIKCVSNEIGLGTESSALRDPPRPADVSAARALRAVVAAADSVARRPRGVAAVVAATTASGAAALATSPAAAPPPLYRRASKLMRHVRDVLLASPVGGNALTSEYVLLLRSQLLPPRADASAYLARAPAAVVRDLIAWAAGAAEAAVRGRRTAAEEEEEEALGGATARATAAAAAALLASASSFAAEAEQALTILSLLLRCASCDVGSEAREASYRAIARVAKALNAAASAAAEEGLADLTASGGGGGGGAEGGASNNATNDADAAGLAAASAALSRLEPSPMAVPACARVHGSLLQAAAALLEREGTEMGGTRRVRQLSLLCRPSAAAAWRALGPSGRLSRDKRIRAAAVAYVSALAATGQLHDDAELGAVIVAARASAAAVAKSASSLLELLVWVRGAVANEAFAGWKKSGADPVVGPSTPGGRRALLRLAAAVEAAAGLSWPAPSLRAVVAAAAAEASSSSSPSAAAVAAASNACASDAAAAAVPGGVHDEDEHEEEEEEEERRRRCRRGPSSASSSLPSSAEAAATAGGRGVLRPHNEQATVVTETAAEMNATAGAAAPVPAPAAKRRKTAAASAAPPVSTSAAPPPPLPLPPPLARVVASSSGSAALWAPVAAAALLSMAPGPTARDVSSMLAGAAEAARRLRVSASAPPGAAAALAAPVPPPAAADAAISLLRLLEAAVVSCPRSLLRALRTGGGGCGGGGGGGGGHFDDDEDSAADDETSDEEEDEGQGNARRRRRSSRASASAALASLTFWAAAWLGCPAAPHAVADAAAAALAAVARRGLLVGGVRGGGGGSAPPSSASYSSSSAPISVAAAAASALATSPGLLHSRDPLPRPLLALLAAAPPVNLVATLSRAAAASPSPPPAPSSSPSSHAINARGALLERVLSPRTLAAAPALAAAAAAALLGRANGGGGGSSSSPSLRAAALDDFEAESLADLCFDQSCSALPRLSFADVASPPPHAPPPVAGDAGQLLDAPPLAQVAPSLLSFSSYSSTSAASTSPVEAAAALDRATRAHRAARARAELARLPAPAVPLTKAAAAAAADSAAAALAAALEAARRSSQGAAALAQESAQQDALAAANLAAACAAAAAGSDGGMLDASVAEERRAALERLRFASVTSQDADLALLGAWHAASVLVVAAAGGDGDGAPAEGERHGGDDSIDESDSDDDSGLAALTHHHLLLPCPALSSSGRVPVLLSDSAPVVASAAVRLAERAGNLGPKRGDPARDELILRSLAALAAAAGAVAASLPPPPSPSGAGEGAEAEEADTLPLQPSLALSRALDIASRELARLCADADASADLAVQAAATAAAGTLSDDELDDDDDGMGGGLPFGGAGGGTAMQFTATTPAIGGEGEQQQQHDDFDLTAAAFPSSLTLGFGGGRGVSGGGIRGGSGGGGGSAVASALATARRDAAVRSLAALSRAAPLVSARALAGIAEGWALGRASADAPGPLSQALTWEEGDYETPPSPAALERLLAALVGVARVGAVVVSDDDASLPSISPAAAAAASLVTRGGLLSKRKDSAFAPSRALLVGAWAMAGLARAAIDRCAALSAAASTSPSSSESLLLRIDSTRSDAADLLWDPLLALGSFAGLRFRPSKGGEDDGDDGVRDADADGIAAAMSGPGFFARAALATAASACLAAGGAKHWSEEKAAAALDVVVEAGVKVPEQQQQQQPREQQRGGRGGAGGAGGGAGGGGGGRRRRQATAAATTDRSDTKRASPLRLAAATPAAQLCRVYVKASAVWLHLERAARLGSPATGEVTRDGAGLALLGAALAAAEGGWLPLCPALDVAPPAPLSLSPSSASSSSSSSSSPSPSPYLLRQDAKSSDDADAQERASARALLTAAGVAALPGLGGGFGGGSCSDGVRLQRTARAALRAGCVGLGYGSRAQYVRARAPWIANDWAGVGYEDAATAARAAAGTPQTATPATHRQRLPAEPTVLPRPPLPISVLAAAAPAVGGRLRTARSLLKELSAHLVPALVVTQNGAELRGLATALFGDGDGNADAASQLDRFAAALVRDHYASIMAAVLPGSRHFGLGTGGGSSHGGGGAGRSGNGGVSTVAGENGDRSHVIGQGLLRELIPSVEQLDDLFESSTPRAVSEILLLAASGEGWGVLPWGRSSSLPSPLPPAAALMLANNEGGEEERATPFPALSPIYASDAAHALLRALHRESEAEGPAPLRALVRARAAAAAARGRRHRAAALGPLRAVVEFLAPEGAARAGATVSAASALVEAALEDGGSLARASCGVLRRLLCLEEGGGDGGDDDDDTRALSGDLEGSAPRLLSLLCGAVFSAAASATADKSSLDAAVAPLVSVAAAFASRFPPEVAAECDVPPTPRALAPVRAALLLRRRRSGGNGVLTGTFAGLPPPPTSASPSSSSSSSFIDDLVRFSLRAPSLAPASREMTARKLRRRLRASLPSSSAAATAAAAAAGTTTALPSLLLTPELQEELEEGDGESAERAATEAGAAARRAAWRLVRAGVAAAEGPSSFGSSHSACVESTFSTPFGAGDSSSSGNPQQQQQRQQQQHLRLLQLGSGTPSSSSSATLRLAAEVLATLGPPKVGANLPPINGIGTGGDAANVPPSERGGGGGNAAPDLKSALVSLFPLLVDAVERSPTQQRLASVAQDCLEALVALPVSKEALEAIHLAAAAAERHRGGSSGRGGIQNNDPEAEATASAARAAADAAMRALPYGVPITLAFNPDEPLTTLPRRSPPPQLPLEGDAAAVASAVAAALQQQQQQQPLAEARTNATVAAQTTAAASATLDDPWPLLLSRRLPPSQWVRRLAFAVLRRARAPELRAAAAFALSDRAAAELLLPHALADLALNSPSSSDGERDIAPVVSAPSGIAGALAAVFESALSACCLSSSSASAAAAASISASSSSTPRTYRHLSDDVARLLLCCLDHLRGVREDAFARAPPLAERPSSSASKRAPAYLASKAEELKGWPSACWLEVRYETVARAALQCCGDPHAAQFWGELAVEESVASPEGRRAADAMADAAVRSPRRAAAGVSRGTAVPASTSSAAASAASAVWRPRGSTGDAVAASVPRSLGAVLLAASRATAEPDGIHWAAALAGGLEGSAEAQLALLQHEGDWAGAAALCDATAAGGFRFVFGFGGCGGGGGGGDCGRRLAASSSTSPSLSLPAALLQLGCSSSAASVAKTLLAGWSSSSYSASSFDSSELRDAAAEAAWRMGQWRSAAPSSSADEASSSSSSSSSFNVSVCAALAAIQERAPEAAASALSAARSSVIFDELATAWGSGGSGSGSPGASGSADADELSALAAPSAAATAAISRLQMLATLEEALCSSSSSSSPSSAAADAPPPSSSLSFAASRARAREDATARALGAGSGLGFAALEPLIAVRRAAAAALGDASAERAALVDAAKAARVAGRVPAARAALAALRAPIDALSSSSSSLLFGSASERERRRQAGAKGSCELPAWVRSEVSPAAPWRREELELLWEGGQHASALRVARGLLADAAAAERGSSSAAADGGSEENGNEAAAAETRRSSFAPSPISPVWRAGLLSLVGKWLAESGLEGPGAALDTLRAATAEADAAAAHDEGGEIKNNAGASAVLSSQLLDPSSSSNAARTACTASFRLASYADKLHAGAVARRSSPEAAKAAALVAARASKLKPLELERSANAAELRKAEAVLAQNPRDAAARDSKARAEQAEKYLAWHIAAERKHLDADLAFPRELARNESAYLSTAISAYGRALEAADAHDLHAVHRFVALFLAHGRRSGGGRASTAAAAAANNGNGNVCELARSALRNVSSHKFVPLVPQIASRLSTVESPAAAGERRSGNSRRGGSRRRRHRGGSDSDDEEEEYCSSSEYRSQLNDSDDSDDDEDDDNGERSEEEDGGGGVPRREDEGTALFQREVADLLVRLGTDHPFHTLWTLLSLKNGDRGRDGERVPESREPSPSSSAGAEAAAGAAAAAKKSNSKKPAMEVNFSKCRAAAAVLGRISAAAPESAALVREATALADVYIRLAAVPAPVAEKPNVPAPTRSTFPSALRERAATIRSLPLVSAPLPVRRDGDYSSAPRFAGFEPEISYVGGINKPKVVKALVAGGVLPPRRELVKSGSDDLRQDAAIQQFFALVNSLLAADGAAAARALRLRTYRAVPFSPSSGLLQWVDDCIPLSEYLLGSDRNSGAHGRRGMRAHRMLQAGPSSGPGSAASGGGNLQPPPPPPPAPILHGTAATAMHRARPQDLRTTFDWVCERFPPVLRHFFTENFRSPRAWAAARLSYARSTAAASMAGYVIGLGDRHSHNILLDLRSAEAVHIDLGIAFEQGSFLATPELVPFRLTRDIVDGLGPAGVDGVLRGACEAAMSAMRAPDARAALASVVEVLVHDPLYKWGISEEKKKKKKGKGGAEKDCGGGENEEEEGVDDDDDGNDPVAISITNADAERALLRVRNKLAGLDAGDGEARGIRAQVRQLLADAADPALLCRMYVGWAAWV